MAANGLPRAIGPLWAGFVRRLIEFVGLIGIVVAATFGGTVAKAGAEFPVNTTTAGDQTGPAIARLANGRFVAVWQGPLGGEDGIDIVMQRFTANGAKAGGEIRVNTFAAGNQLLPAVAGLLGGEFVVVWVALKDASGVGIWGQRFRADGNKIGREFRISGGAFAVRARPRVAMLADGSFVVVWERQTSQEPAVLEVFGQRFSADGKKAGNEFRVSKPGPNNNWFASVAGLPDGGFVVTWQELTAGNDPLAVFAQRFSSAGDKAFGPIRVDKKATTEVIRAGAYPRVAAAAGGFVVAWQQIILTIDPPQATFDIRVQRFAADGSKIGGALRVAEHGNVVPDPLSLTIVDVCGFDDGSFVVVWHFGDIFAQRYDAGGNKIGGRFRVNNTTAGQKTSPAVATLLDAGFAVLWRSPEQDGDEGGIFGRKFDQ